MAAVIYVILSSFGVHEPSSWNFLHPPLFPRYTFQDSATCPHLLDTQLIIY